MTVCLAFNRARQGYHIAEQKIEYLLEAKNEQAATSSLLHWLLEVYSGFPFWHARNSQKRNSKETLQCIKNLANMETFAKIEPCRPSRLMRYWDDPDERNSVHPCIWHTGRLKLSCVFAFCIEFGAALEVHSSVSVYCITIVMHCSVLGPLGNSGSLGDQFD